MKPSIIVAVSALVVTAPSMANDKGKEIYQTYCVACHSTGVPGAPQLGDAAAWDARVKKGKATLYTNAVNGLNAMPPKGLCMSCSDEDIQAAVDYIISSSQ